MIKGKSFVVTGGAGFIGANSMLQLIKDNNEVIAIDNLSLRYFNVFGPRQDTNSQYAAVIPKFITAILQGRRPVIYGDGEQSRDFTYVLDNVNASLLACSTNAAAGKVFNIACGKRTTLNELVEILNNILETDIKPVYTDPQPGDVKHSMADISRARKALGFEPEFRFEDGLKQTVDWFKLIILK